MKLDDHDELVLMMAALGYPAFGRGMRFPYDFVLWPTTDLDAIHAAMKAHPLGSFETDRPAVEGVPVANLAWQMQNLRWDDPATRVLRRIRPNYECNAFENLAMGERLIPVYPTDALFGGNCTCWQGIARPHRAGHPCFPLDWALQDDTAALFNLFVAVPGFEFRRVVDGKLLPLLPGVLSVPAFRSWAIQAAVKGHL